MNDKNKRKKHNEELKGKKTEEAKNLLTLKSMYFNRYLMVRYALALFLFSNFYWMLFLQKSVLVALPLAMLIFCLYPCYENFKCYGQARPSMRWTRIFFMCQCVVNMFVIVSVFTPLFKTILPVLTDTTISRVFASSVAFIGWFIDLACLRRFRDIKNNEDKQFKRIIEFERVTHVHL